MYKIGICLSACILCCSVTLAADESEVFRRVLTNASRISTLTLPGAEPFHLKLSAKERKQDQPEYRTEIEVWWSSPERWRREVRSAGFTQTAVRRGELYFESNSADYLPFWLHELIQESVDPIPLVELLRDQVDLTKRGCAEWQQPYSKEKETAYVHQSICFNHDGTVNELFTPTVDVLLGNYRDFAGRKVAGSITVWHPSNAEIVGSITILEPLRPDDSLFALPGNTPFPARLRFVSAPEAALELDTPHSAPLSWPVVHNFPASGVMAINLKLDRQGTVREIGSIVSTNFVLTETARDQIQKWKFKPYLIDGAPVQVNTTLAIHFDARMELLGEGGKALPVEPFLQRIKKSRELSDPRTTDGVPFHLHTTIQGNTGQIGSYDEIWNSEQQWKREIHFGSITLLLTRSGEQTSQELKGASRIPTEISELLDLLVTGHFPDRRYTIYEADWGQSAVTFAGVDTVRVARGKVDASNQPISGQAYWFDSSGFLRGDYEEPFTTTYAEFAPWKNKSVPRRLEVIAGHTRKWLLMIDRLEPIPQ